jgi:DNA repair protein RadA/Sms
MVVGLVPSSGPPVPIAEVDPTEFTPRPTGIAELDRVLGGGLVPGSVTLLGGEPGIGKSTLLLQAAAEVAAAGRKVLYVSGEESPQQIRLRAERLGALHPELYLAAETSCPHVVAMRSTSVEPDLVVVDSIQTWSTPSSPRPRVRWPRCASAATGWSRRRSRGMCRGARRPRHQGRRRSPALGCSSTLVDTVLSFEGDRHHALRLLRVVKHRFGSTQELGLFQMTEHGLVGVPDPSGLFLADRRSGIPGLGRGAHHRGNRPLLVELQVLTTSLLPSPRRSAQGSMPAGFPCSSPCSRSGSASHVANRRVRAGRRGCAGHRARAPTSPRAGRSRRSSGHGRCRPIWWPAVRLASVVSCARWPTPPGAWPKRPASGSSGPSSPQRARAARGHRAMRVGTWPTP